MKKSAKKLISIFLCIVLLALSLIPMACAQEVNLRESELPTVYVTGQGEWLFENYGTPEQKTIYPLTFNMDEIVEKAKGLMPSFAKGVFTNNYEDYANELYDIINPIFEPVRLDKNGNARNNSSSYIDWVPGQKLDDKKGAYGYGLWNYRFQYDWRLDPVEVAENLKLYIDAVLEATNAPKVNIVSRCLGSNIVLAYLTKYGNENKVASNIFYASCIDGAMSCSKLFTGEIEVDAAALNRFCAFKFKDGDYLKEFLKATVALFEKTYSLHLLTGTINKIYDKVSDQVAPKIIYGVYGNMPAYWSLVGPDDYEKAKDFVFGDNTEEYSGLIEKLDRYHYDVQLKARETLTALSENGMNIANVSKYAVQLAPVVEGADIQADTVVELVSSSLGATCSPIDKTLGDAYTQKQPCCGKNHVSPDNKVDASTCLFPDKTWFIKGVDHKDFSGSIDKLLFAIMNYNGSLTVFDDERFPQFMVYDYDTDDIYPMTNDNMNTEKWTDDTVLIFKTFIQKLFVVIKHLFEKG